MAKAYRFDDVKPRIGRSASAFRTLSDAKRFVNAQGGLYGSMKYWEIDGSIEKDEGGPDGITIVVRSARQIN